MVIGILEHRVELLQLDPGILCCEPPPHFGLRPIAMALPSSDFVPQHCYLVDPAVKALTRKNTQFGLRHIQPAATNARTRIAWVEGRKAVTAADDAMPVRAPFAADEALPAHSTPVRRRVATPRPRPRVGWPHHRSGKVPLDANAQPRDVLRGLR